MNSPGIIVLQRHPVSNEDLYSIAARVKNLARDYDAQLTPIGEAMCNLYVHVLVDLYGFAETLPKKQGTLLKELIKSKEGFPRDVINLNKKRR